MDGVASPPTAIDRWLVRRLLTAQGRPPVEWVLWNGEREYFGDGPPVARVHLRDRLVLRDLIRNPSLALGDGYADGRIGVEGELLRLLETVFRSSARAPRWAHALRGFFGSGRRRNTRRRARDNVHEHYDLGNEFYRLWLDESLAYTCAYFPTPEASLEEAQLAKMDHVCRKLALRSDERVVEAGCGWGTLALHMAERFGVRVLACNVSGEQIRHAREQARRRGLEHRVEFREEDYRNLRGRYDAFVSVGMLEHVGKSEYRTLGRVMEACLEPDGRGLVHSIARACPQRMNAWIERRIFPGSYIPSLAEMMELFEPQNLAILDVENLRLHYALTLNHWLARFETAADRVQSMFDERFVRIWRLYLASSAAAFWTGSCQLYQVVFSRAGNERIPWTRAHVYSDAAVSGSGRFPSVAPGSRARA